MQSFGPGKSTQGPSNGGRHEPLASRKIAETSPPSSTSNPTSSVPTTTIDRDPQAPTDSAKGETSGIATVQDLREFWRNTPILHMVGNITRAAFFRRILSRDADHHYFAKYSNGATPTSPLSPAIREELHNISSWLSDPKQNRTSLIYLGVLSLLRIRDADGNRTSGLVGHSSAFARIALEHYRATFAADKDVLKALDNVERFFEMAPTVHYESAAWWLIANMAARKGDRAELIKSLEESASMRIVAESLPRGVTESAARLCIQPAKERVLLDRESLIPSFDFRVHYHSLRGYAHGQAYGSALGFFEIKRVDRLMAATDITSCVRNLVSTKIEKPYQNPDGSTTRLADHPGLKVLIIQAPWPTDGRSFVERKGGGTFCALDADGNLEHGRVQDGAIHIHSRSNLFAAIADKLNELRGTDMIDGVYVTSYEGELIQAFYRGAEIDEWNQARISPTPTDAAWEPFGTRQISVKSFFDVPVARTQLAE